MSTLIDGMESQVSGNVRVVSGDTLRNIFAAHGRPVPEERTDVVGHFPTPTNVLDGLVRFDQGVRSWRFA
jgi:hypothetical protein